jgi:putative transposase
VKSGDADFLRMVAESVLQLLMEADVEGVIGAGRFERNADHQTWRNGYRDRTLETRLGPLSLRIPKLPDEELVQAMGLSGISKSSVSKLCKEIDERVSASLERPLDGEWPYLKVREGGRIVPVAAIVAVAVTTEGRREIVGLHIGPSEAEPFWTTFLRALVKRGLRGVKLVIGDAHEGLKAAITRVVGATWQRCRVHFMCNALAHVPKSQTTMVAAAIRQVFLQPDHPQAVQSWRHVADQLRARWPKLGGLMDEAKADVLAYMAFPSQHRTKLHATNPLERLNKELKRRADGVGVRAMALTPQRGQYRAPCRCRAPRGQRRMVTPAPLHADRSHGRTRHTTDRGADRALIYTPRRITHGHPALHLKLHHGDGRYHSEPPSRRHDHQCRRRQMMLLHCLGYGP